MTIGLVWYHCHQTNKPLVSSNECARQLQLIVYGPGRVEPSTLEAVVPGLRYSVAVSASPDVDYGRMILVMRRGFCTDVAGHRFRRSSNSSFTLRFGTYYRPNFYLNITTH